MNLFGYVSSSLFLSSFRHVATHISVEEYTYQKKRGLFHCLSLLVRRLCYVSNTDLFLLINYLPPLFSQACLHFDYAFSKHRTSARPEYYFTGISPLITVCILCFKDTDTKFLRVSIYIFSPVPMHMRNTTWKNHWELIGQRKMLLFSRHIISNSLQFHGLQEARLPCPSPSLGV